MITSFPGCGITVVDACSAMGVVCPLRLVVLRIQDGSRGTVKDNDPSFVLLTRFVTSAMNSLLWGSQIHPKSMWFPSNLRTAMSTPCWQVAIVARGVQHCVTPLITSLSQQPAQHLLALWKPFSDEEAFRSASDWFLYGLQPKCVLCSAIGSYHLIMVKTQEKWQ